MEKDIFNEKNILIDSTSTTQDQAFKSIAELVAGNDYATSADEFYEGLKNRELETTTGFKNGIAIPHSNDDSVLKTGLFFIKFSNPIEWNALDKKPVDTALALSIPKNGGKEHLKILSSVARKLMDEEFTNSLKEETDIKKIVELINEI
ncbi:PTS sugar transporter subunit IIA [Lactobacillus sp. YT155]|uniref:PTS sugar transporter subunit IIA n=1 Tax=Lactobacillus sp. YT155 TaxID=3060955 RepID=UPI00265E04CF|nr:PTS sugar transporter subunit IIA [Lactobacillus sp. YT155]MDO1604495.1 PTS sugar transporter subunit IIA [Lactobacillus sp. YT155]